MTQTMPALDWQPAIMAAGASARFGTNKLFADLCGRPVLRWSIEGMCSVSSPHPLIVVVASASEEAVRALLAAMGMTTGALIVRGGPRRRDSVAAAMRAASAEYVAVHDGARPLVAADLLRRVLAGAAGLPGAVPATPLTDTVATVDGNGHISGHPDRSVLRALQTPQVVRRADWLDAAAFDPTDATDDSAMLARLGLSCAAVEGDPANLKITRPSDLAVARALLGERGTPCTG